MVEARPRTIVREEGKERRQQGLVVEARRLVREEGRRQQGLVMEARKLVREEGRRQQGLVMEAVEARPRVLGINCLIYRRWSQGKGKDKDAVFVLAVACYC